MVHRRSDSALALPDQEADKAHRKAELQASYEEKMAAKKAEKEEAGEEGQMIGPPLERVIPCFSVCI